MTSSNSYYLGTYWKERKITTGNFLEKTYGYLKLLAPQLKDYQAKIVNEDGNLLPLSWELESFKKSMLPIVFNNDAWYFNEKGTRSTTIALESTSDSGYYAQFIFEGQKDIVKVNIREGCHEVTSPDGYTYGNEIPNSVLVYLPFIDPFKSFQYAKELFLQTIKFWNPSNGLVVSNEFLNEMDLEDNDFFIGWLNYLANIPNKINFPSDIQKEKLNGGTVLALTDELEQTPKSSTIKLALTTQKLLNSYGLLNWNDGY